MKLGIINGYSASSFDYVKSIGLDFIEVCRNDDNEAADFIAKADSVKAEIKRTGLPIQSVGRWNCISNVGGRLDADKLALQKGLLDAAIKVGSPNFVCGINYDDSVSLYRNLTIAIEFFGRMIEQAKASGSGIKIAAYNCSWGNFVYEPNVWKVVLGELPELMIKYDCSHSCGRGADYLAELSDWGDRIAHMHVKGFVSAGRRGVDDPPAGIDSINWPTVFAILYSRGYDAGLSIEPHSATWRGDSELGRAGVKFTTEYIRRFILR